MSGIVEAVRGEGRTGRAGLVSILNDLIKDNESGIAAPLVLKGPAPRRLLLMMLCVYLASYNLAEAHVGTLRPSGRPACRFAKVGNIKSGMITWRDIAMQFAGSPALNATIEEVKGIGEW